MKFVKFSSIGATLFVVGMLATLGSMKIQSAKAEQKPVQHSAVAVVIGTLNDNKTLGINYFSAYGPDAPEVYQGEPLAQLQAQLKDRVFALDHADGIFLYYSR